MRTKTFCVRFFKDSLNKRAETSILELDEGSVSLLVKFEYQRSSSKNDRFFERTNMIFRLCPKKQDDLLSWKTTLLYLSD